MLIGYDDDEEENYICFDSPWRLVGLLIRVPDFETSVFQELQVLFQLNFTLMLSCNVFICSAEILFFFFFLSFHITGSDNLIMAQSFEIFLDVDYWFCVESEL